MDQISDMQHIKENICTCLHVSKWRQCITAVTPWDKRRQNIIFKTAYITPVAAHRLSIVCSWISRKVKVLELRNLHSAYINMRIPFILRPNSSVYDLQKLRYRCARRALKGRGKISMFAQVTVNDSTLVLFLMVKLARNHCEKSCCSYSTWAC